MQRCFLWDSSERWEKAYLHSVNFIYTNLHDNQMKSLLVNTWHTFYSLKYLCKMHFSAPVTFVFDQLTTNSFLCTTSLLSRGRWMAKWWPSVYPMPNRERKWKTGKRTHPVRKRKKTICQVEFSSLKEQLNLSFSGSLGSFKWLLIVRNSFRVHLKGRTSKRVVAFPPLRNFDWALTAKENAENWVTSTASIAPWGPLETTPHPASV